MWPAPKNQVAWKLAELDLLTALYLSLFSKVSDENFSFTLKGVPVQADVSTSSNVIICHFIHISVIKSSGPLHFILLMKVIYPLHTNSDLWGRMIFWEDNRVSKNNLELGHFKLSRRLNMVFDAYASPKKAEFEVSLCYIVKAGGRKKGRGERKEGQGIIKSEKESQFSALP